MSDKVKLKKPYGFFIQSMIILLYFEVIILIEGINIFPFIGFGLAVVILRLVHQGMIYKKFNSKFWNRPEWYWIVVTFLFPVFLTILLITLVQESEFGAHVCFLFFAFLFMAVMPLRVYKINFQTE